MSNGQLYTALDSRYYRTGTMKKLLLLLRRSRLWRETEGQDLIEYSLLVSFLAVIAAAAIPTGISQPLQTIFQKVLDLIAKAP